jgi:hypothetical protein
MSFRIIRMLARWQTIVPAVLAFHIGVAAAAGSADDFMQQQRDLLAGRRIATTAAPSVAQHRSGEGSSTGDAQESARELLLGVAPGRLRPDVSRVSRDRVYGDAQMLARQLLLGNRGAPPAGARRQSHHPALTQRATSRQ